MQVELGGLELLRVRESEALQVEREAPASERLLATREQGPRVAKPVTGLQPLAQRALPQERVREPRPKRQVRPGSMASCDRGTSSGFR